MVIRFCVFFLRQSFILYVFLYIMYICAQNLLPYFQFTSKVDFFYKYVLILSENQIRKADMRRQVA